MESKYRQKIFFYEFVSGAGCMTHNGPAIKGVCVGLSMEAVSRNA